MLFSVPHTRKRKRYLEALDAGLDADGKVPFTSLCKVKSS
jgi:hypothetical protein